METIERRSLGWRVLASVAAWATAVVLLSESGVLGRMSPYAPPAVALLTIVVPCGVYFASGRLRAYLAGLGLRRLTALHGLRIAAVPLFFWYGRRGLLPQPFVEAAGWGDLAAGLLALGVVTLYAKPAGYWTMHVLGMVDFVTAFGTAMRLTLAQPAAMHAITGLPMALIPFFGVGVLATTHTIAYDLLLGARSVETGARLGMQPAEAR